VSLLAQLIGPASGLSAKLIENLLEQYKEELFQFRYNYKYQSIKQRLVDEEIKEADTIARIMEKVDKLTVEDEDILQVINRDRDAK
jgi:hypothetical protein